MHEYKNLKKELKKILSLKKFEHSVSVSNVASDIGMLYNQDCEKLKIAGLLHDCGKELPDCEYFGIIERELNIKNITRDEYQVFHGLVGAFYAKTKFHITDVDILNAISNHTVGRKGMNLFEKIIYIADVIEPTRKKCKNKEKVRELVYQKKIDQAILLEIENKLNYLKIKNIGINKKTLELKNELLNNVK